jgi:hypothetical protein
MKKRVKPTNILANHQFLNGKTNNRIGKAAHFLIVFHGLSLFSVKYYILSIPSNFKGFSDACEIGFWVFFIAVVAQPVSLWGVGASRFHFESLVCSLSLLDFVLMGLHLPF